MTELNGGRASLESFRILEGFLRGARSPNNLQVKNTKRRNNNEKHDD